MNDSLKNIFTVTDLRNRVLFTLGMLAVYRLGHNITVPGVNISALGLESNVAVGVQHGEHHRR